MAITQEDKQEAHEDEDHKQMHSSGATSRTHC